MKQGLSLRVSQHLALTPQLQQSIRLLQLSTLELSQEVEQMLDENPFLERTMEEAAREEFGVDTADAPATRDDVDGDDFAIGAGAGDADADVRGLGHVSAREGDFDFARHSPGSSRRRSHRRRSQES